jgi:hypothetical protein
MKKNLISISAIIILFAGAIFIFYLAIIWLQSQNINTSNELNSIDFLKSIYPELKDLGKFFLTLIIGVFVASITFSEKIVNFNTSSTWAKGLLILCWIFLLLSIVFDGTGLVYLTNWYTIGLLPNDGQYVINFTYAFFCFGISGIIFGFALTSLLAAGLMPFIQHRVVKEKTDVH